MLEPIEQPLDVIAFPINRFVKWTFSTYVTRLGNSEPNTSAAQKAANRSATICFVADNAFRPDLRPTTARAFDRAMGHQRLKGRSFVALARREHQCHRLALAFSTHVDLRTEATAAPS